MFVAILGSAFATSASGRVDLDSSGPDATAAKAFLGRWDLALTAFVSPKGEEETPTDWVFDGKLNGTTLSGSVTGPKGGPWTWSGVRAPLLQRKGKPNWGKPISLFNGKDLTGWKMSDPNPTTVWKVENGTLVSPGHGPEIIHEQKFQDFKLHVEFNCGANANSRVYLRGRYEVQIEDNSIQERPVTTRAGCTVSLLHRRSYLAGPENGRSSISP